MAAEFSIHDEASRQRVIAFISALNIEKQKWRVEVKRLVKKRSLSQNSLMHKWFQVIADEVGDNMESVKEDYIKMYSPLIERKTINGETEMRHKRTSEHGKAESSDFMDKIQAHAGSFLGIMLPDPRDLGSNPR